MNPKPILVTLLNVGTATFLNIENILVLFLERESKESRRD